MSEVAVETPARGGIATRRFTVLAGCSFAGLEFLYRLSRRRRLAPGEIVVVEPRERHPYIPLAHETVIGRRAPRLLQFDTPAFCRSIGATFLRDSLASLDAAEHTVTLASGRVLAYDRLVLAVGSVPDIPAAFAQSPSVVAAKFLDDPAALHRRLHVLRVQGARVLRAVVVGGGITAVEWSAEAASARVDGVRIVTTLVGGEPRLLPRFHPRVARRTAHLLSALRIETLLGRRALGIAGDHVLLEQGVSIPFDMILWAAGVRANPVLAALSLPLTEDGHVAVTPRLAVPGFDGIYAMGDCARVASATRDRATTDRAIDAIWQGAYLARRVAAGWQPDAGPAFRPRRNFPYGMSLGPRRSAILYRGLYADLRLFVWFRRWLQWGYYARFRIEAWRRG
ncbi:MAG: NAD(P)/FAD-dependent oxidoreductase [Gemmatimonadaceae bacterium]